MARGFESKAVADQQDSAQAPRPVRAGPVPDPPLVAKRRRLELSRADVTGRLAEARTAGHREMLERALLALENELAALR